MDEDAFFRSAKADWRGWSTDLDPVRRKVERRRRIAVLQLMAEAGGGVLALTAAGWFLLRAFTGGELLDALAAAALLAATCLALLGVVRGRRDLARRADGTARGLLLQMVSDARSAKQGLRRLRWSGWVLLAALTGALVLSASGLMEGLQGLKLSLAWGGAALAILVWSTWRERRVTAEWAACDQLLAELDASSGGDEV